MAPETPSSFATILDELRQKAQVAFRYHIKDSVVIGSGSRRYFINKSISDRNRQVHLDKANLQLKSLSGQPGGFYTLLRNADTDIYRDGILHA